MGAVINADRSLGIGQTWQDVKASRAHNVTYQNTTGRTVAVAVGVENNGTDGGILFYVSPDNLTWTLVYIASIGLSLNDMGVVVPVPPGYFYKAMIYGTYTSWAELRV